MLIRDEQLDRFYSAVDNLGIDANLAYKLLIDIPREKRRKDNVEINGEILDKLIQLLAEQIIIPEQLELVLPAIIENPQICNDELLGKINHKEITNEALDKIIFDKVNTFGKDKFSTPEEKTRNIPKVVFQILNECNFSVRGEMITTKINILLEEVS